MSRAKDAAKVGAAVGAAAAGTAVLVYYTKDWISQAVKAVKKVMDEED